MGGVGGGMGVGEGRSPTLLLLFVMVIVHDSTAYPQHPRQCLTQKNCNHGEYCEDQEKECRCKKNYVREPAGGCLAVRRENEPCILDKQCSSVDHRLLCHDGRCNCPHGMRRSDGTCVVSVTVAPPTMPTHQGSGRIGHAPTSRRKPKTAQGMDGGMSGSVIFPVIICIIIFLTFCVLMLIIAYSFRVHNRRLAARRSYHVVASTPRRSPVCGRRDVPPYYTSLPPPSYDQATLNASGPLHISSRYSSCTASIETTPYTLSSPDMSSSISYGSLLTRSFLLTPSDHAPSLTDLTTGDARRDRGDTTPSPPHRY